MHDTVKTMGRKFAAPLVCGTLLATPSASGTLKYEPDDYVQDGLVVMLDGIHNVGAHLPHDASATSWVNLADASKPARINASNSSGWRDGCGYYFCYDGNASYARLVSETPAMTQASFEFVFEGSAAAQTARSWGPYFINDGSSNKSICMGDPSDNILRFTCDGWTGNDGSQRPVISNWSWKQASFTLGAAGSAGLHAYDQGVLRDTRVRTTAEEGAIPAATWVVGCRLDEPSHVWYARQLTGLMKCVRIYNRELTADEVAANATIDAARFDGVMPVTNAIVATAVSCANGNERPGIYAVDGSHTFTAPQSVTVGSTTYACAGYTLETWEDGAWSSPVSQNGMSCTVLESEMVRIIWMWTPVHGIRSAADYDVDDYVQGGLVVMLDGIHNVGAHLPHDASATSWANLADASKPARINASNSSGWRDGCGYYFCYDGNASYARLVSETPAMTQASFEFVFEGSAAAQTARSWGPYFINDGSSNKSICMGDPSDNILRFVSDGWTGNDGSQRPVISNWSWKQASFTFGAAGNAGLHAYDQGVLRDTRVRTSAAAGSIPAATWAVGCRLDEPSRVWYARQLTGIVKSVRIYDRELTAAEIAHNWKVDAARFDGALTVTNVVVAGKYDNYEGVAAGFYEVEGAYTFTAGAATDAKGNVRPVVGYTIETWNGSEWSAAQTFNGVSYTYTVGTNPAKVRLTWKWQPDGMKIIVR